MKIIGCILGVVALLAIRSAIQDGFKTAITAATSDQAATCLALLGSTTRVEDRATFIIGNVQNRCDRRFGDVTITFKLDRPTTGPTNRFSGGSAYAYVKDLAPGETRGFKSEVYISSNTTYHFDKITAY